MHRRFLYLALGFLLLLLFGTINSWSVFIGPLEAEFGWQRTQTSSVFTVTMCCFCIGNLAAGALSARTSARVGLGIAAALSAAGFVLASFTTTLPFIYVSYGVLCGIAVGMGTNGVMSIVLPWFPDRQGAASGMLLMGIGFGSLLLGPAVTALLGFAGWRVTFRLLGVAFGALLGIGALVLHEPRPSAIPAACADRQQSSAASQTAVPRTTAEIDTRSMLRSSAFWGFFAWAALIGAGGLAVVGNAVPAAQDVLVASGMDANAAVMPATLAMGAISVLNGLARPFAGWTWDRAGSRIPLRVIPAVYALSMVLCAAGSLTALFPVLVAGFLLLGMAHGASQSVTSALVRTFFGARHYSANYACAQCNLMAAALVGPMMAGAVRSATGSYLACYLALVLFAAVAFAAARIIKKPA